MSVAIDAFCPGKKFLLFYPSNLSVENVFQLVLQYSHDFFIELISKGWEFFMKVTVTDVL